jgi:threonine 3-dehydrogenase
MSTYPGVRKIVSQIAKSGKVNRVFITGGNGALSNELLPYLTQLYGESNILLTDIHNTTGLNPKHFATLDMTDRKTMESLIKDFKPDTILHLGSILSAAGEKNPQMALSVNIEGSRNAIDLATEYKCRIYTASTTASFGTEANKVLRNIEFQRPKTVYGISKVFMELYGEYHHYKHGTDFRALRYPVVIAPMLSPGATAMCTIDIYYGALRDKKYKMYLKPDQQLPIIYIDDLITGTLQFLEAPNEKLKYRTYNIASLDYFSIKDQVENVKKHVKGFECTYEIDARQKIAETWPWSADPKEASEHWGYKRYYDNLDKITQTMIEKVPAYLAKEKK